MVLNGPWLQCIEALEACEQYFADFVCSVNLTPPPRRERSRPRPESRESRGASRPNRRHNWRDAEDIQYTRQIVGEHMQRHLGANLRQCLHQEVRGTHSHLHCTEGMLDRLTARSHGLRIFVEPFLYGLDNLLVLPPRDATLFARRALSFD